MPLGRGAEIKPELGPLSPKDSQGLLQTMVYHDSVRRTHQTHGRPSKLFFGQDYADDLCLKNPQSRRGAIVELPYNVDPTNYARIDFDQNQSDSQNSIYSNQNISKISIHESSKSAPYTQPDNKRKHAAYSKDDGDQGKHSDEVPPSPGKIKSESRLKFVNLDIFKERGIGSIFDEVCTKPLTVGLGEKKSQLTQR